MYSKITIALALAAYDLAYGVELEGILDWIPELTPHGPGGNGMGGLGEYD